MARKSYCVEIGVKKDVWSIGEFGIVDCDILDREGVELADVIARIRYAEADNCFYAALVDNPEWFYGLPDIPEENSKKLAGLRSEISAIAFAASRSGALRSKKDCMMLGKLIDKSFEITGLELADLIGDDWTLAFNTFYEHFADELPKFNDLLNEEVMRDSMSTVTADGDSAIKEQEELYDALAGELDTAGFDVEDDFKDNTFAMKYAKMIRDFIFSF